jgi:D-alanine--poly(phosphoribitol) ligase subunit 1
MAMTCFSAFRAIDQLGDWPHSPRRSGSQGSAQYRARKNSSILNEMTHASNVILDNSAFERIAFFDNEVSLCRTDVENCAEVLSAHSASRIQEIQQGVCILMSRGAHYIAALFAAWRAGFYVVPLNTSWPLQKNLEIIDRIRPAAVMIDDDNATLDIKWPVLTSAQLFSGRSSGMERLAADRGRRMLASDVAYVIFTSGSTGEPKGVVISAGSFRSYVDWTQRFFCKYEQSQRLLLTSELTFDITMGDIAFALAFGTDIGVARHNTNIPSVLAMIMRHNIDVLYSVPTTHLALVAFASQKRGADLSSLRVVLSGGDKFPWQLVKDYLRLTDGAHFYNVYGPTEVTINCFAARLDTKLDLAEQGKPVPIGECFDSLDYVLLNEEGAVTSEGELCVAGPQLMLGYHGDTDRTEAAFASDPRLPFVTRPIYRTGDIGYEDGGLIYLKGRVDGLVKIRGYRVHPDEVSKAIDAIAGVEVSAVVAFGAQAEAALAAFVKPKKSFELKEADIVDALEKKIPRYMIPIKFLFVEDFPLNQSGKIDKNALSRRLL